MATPRADSYAVASGQSVYAGIAPAVTAQLVLTGPSSGMDGVVAPFFTVTYTGSVTGSAKVTMSDGAGGQFWPLEYAADKSVTLSSAKPSAVFFYAPSGAGAKSIALSNNAALANPTPFAFTASAYTPPSATPFRLTRGGATIGSYATLQRCKDIGGYQSGDVIKVAGGTYVVYDVTDPGNVGMTNNPGGIQMGVEVDTLTIEWETPGQPMVLDYSRNFMVSMWTGGQPQAFTVGATCRDLTLRGIHIRGARPPMGASWFGAAIWSKISSATASPTINVEHCKIYECPDGIKTGDSTYALTVNVRNSVFENNSDNRGLDHDIYTGRNALTLVEGCTFRKTPANPYPQLGMGHFVKSRCRQTIVRGCLFDGWMSPTGIGGVAQTINTPNGGVVEITGNVILHYGALSTSGRGEPLRYGDDQHTQTVDTNIDPALQTHSLLFAQNTVRQVLGRPADGTNVHAIQIYPTGLATTLLSGTLVQIPVTATVRNNVVSNDTPGATVFLTRYPDNSIVSGATISDLGLYSGSTIPGSPAVSDAAYEWVGEFTAPAARSDTKRGGRTPYMPGWVPTTAWQWKSIPGTVWTDYIKTDGTGVAPAVTSNDPGPGKDYRSTWDFSGPAFSRKNHELWMFGGGHQATTINIVTRWNFHQELPTVSMVCAPTLEATRRTEALTPNYATYVANARWSDGKPKAPHSYQNNLYIDARDEFVCWGISTCGSGDGGGSLDGAPIGWPDLPSLSRAGVWQSQSYIAPLPAAVYDYQGDRGPRAIASDGSAIYYWVSNTNSPRYGCNKYTFSTNTHAKVGGVAFDSQRCTDEYGGKVLSLTNVQTAGWVGRYIDVTTGAATPITFTVIGTPLASTMQLFDVDYASDLGCYFAVWVNYGAIAWPNSPGNLTSIVISKITPTGSNTATVESMTVATGDGVPTRCSAIRGAFYDATYKCLLLALSHSDPIKAIKVT